MITSKPIMVITGVIILIAGGLYLKKKVGDLTAQNVAQGVVGVLADVATGTVFGIGDAIGVPRTNESECQAALRDGRTLDASFKCPAGTFLGSIFNSATPSPQPHYHDPVYDASAVPNLGIVANGTQYDQMGNVIY